MVDATSLTPPTPGLSATKRVEPYSLKGPENVKKKKKKKKKKTISMYGETFRAATRHNDSCCGLLII